MGPFRQGLLPSPPYFPPSDLWFWAELCPPGGNAPSAMRVWGCGVFGEVKSHQDGPHFAGTGVIEKGEACAQALTQADST